MKVIKAIFFTVVITLAVLIIEPIRFFVGMAGFVIFGMLIADTMKNYRKIKRAEDIKGKGERK
ncbi:MAG: hypothetical protein MSA01_06530 [Anaeromassilibacillus sp.]|nr:hypothetical protein [Anaeromassilibacillus sp.]MDY3780556.1 hypothetical protein [Candidatus Limousia pullorum]